jgi:hypothetical protein
MSDAVGTFVQLLLASLGLIAGVESGSAAIIAVVVAAAVIVVLVHALVLPASARAALSYPSRAIDVSAPLSQSDPDAAGHPRSRAPGFAASAA